MASAPMGPGPQPQKPTGGNGAHAIRKGHPFLGWATHIPNS